MHKFWTNFGPASCSLRDLYAKLTGSDWDRQSDRQSVL